MPASATTKMATAPINQLLSGLIDGKPIDTSCEGSRLHMEKPVPYLCVYRQYLEGNDPTPGLLLGGMGSVFMLQSTDSHIGQYQWIDEIAMAMVDIFGAFMVVEIWFNPVVASAEDTEKSISFHVHTTETGVETGTLQAFEKAIAEQNWHGYAPNCKVSYEPLPGPPDYPSLVHEESSGRQDPHYFGIEIDAVFTDPETGQIRPEVMRSIGNDFTQCLKKALCVFARKRSRFPVRHYHQLGTQLITDVALAADRCLTKLGKAVDLILYATPVNAGQALADFTSSSFQQSPEFHYRPLVVSPNAMKETLFSAPIEGIEDPSLHFIFAERRSELDRQITMLGDRDTWRFLLGSQQIYEPPDEILVTAANAVLFAVAPDEKISDRPEYITAAELRDEAEDMLRAYRKTSLIEARVEVRDDLPGIMVSDGNLLIGRDAIFSKKRLAAVLGHEIGTHIVTHHNGAAQPFKQLQVGLAGYQALQEGLAILAEYLCGGLTSGRARQIAGRVLAVRSVVDGAEFMETFRLLHNEHGFGPNAAFNITMRAHRSGGFTKDAVYLRGVMQVLNLLSEGHKIEDMLVGKFAAQHIDIIEELRWREILKPCQILPVYLETDAAKTELRDLAKGKTFLDLLGEGQWK